MKLTFYGAAGGNVIPSRILLGSTLLDCGDEIPKKESSNRKIDFGSLKPPEVETVLFSHSHTDHIAAIWALVQSGFNGGIESTGPTKEIGKALLIDNYKKDLVDAVFKLYKSPRRFLERFEIAEGIYATFYPACGHILGASSILVEFEKEKPRVLFSGDLGNTNKNMLEVNGVVPEADIVIMESTYGYREHHPDFELSLKELYKGINETYDKGGNFYIPVLSIHKLQEALYYQNLGIEKGQIPDDINVMVDSTLGEVVTEIYLKAHNREYFSKDAQNYFNTYSKAAPFNYTNDINEGGKNIILASSGLDGLRGKFRKHLQDLSNDKNSIAVVSHRIEGSLLDDIALGKETIGTNGHSIELNAKSFTLSGFSSHADATQLVNWLEKTKAKYVFLVHGENDSRNMLKQMIIAKGLCPEKNIFTPAMLEAFNLTSLASAGNSCSINNVEGIEPDSSLKTKHTVFGYELNFKKPLN